jgi:hypothetical protein
MRVLSQNGLQTSIGMSLSGGIGGEQRIATLLTKLEEKGIKINDLAARIKSPILFVPPHGGNPAYGFEATFKLRHYHIYVLHYPAFWLNLRFVRVIAVDVNFVFAI